MHASPQYLDVGVLNHPTRIREDRFVGFANLQGLLSRSSSTSENGCNRRIAFYLKNDLAHFEVPSKGCKRLIAFLQALNNLPSASHISAFYRKPRFQ